MKEHSVMVIVHILCSHNVISGRDLSPLDPMCSSIVLPNHPSTGKQFTTAFYPTCQGLSEHVQSTNGDFPV